jgi:ribokinase
VGLFLKGEVLPKKGETVIGHTFHEGPGGKGSNQAIAASRLGALVTFIARVGRDKYGHDAIYLYENAGVSIEHISIEDSIHTGISVIIIDSDGANLISVVPGANFKLSTADIDRAEAELKSSRIVGFQLESSFDVVDYGLRKCSSLEVETLLDPAPAMQLPHDIFPAGTYIKPNEHEASIITGIEVADYDSAVEAGRWLIDKGVGCAIITLGENGCVMVSRDHTRIFDSFQVAAYDTTGAGDCFSGGFMAALAAGRSAEDAIMFANCAASISVTRIGVVESLPTLDQVREKLESLGMTEIES